MDIRCANCSAKITLERDEPFLKCPYCDSTLFLDRAQTFKRFLLPPSISDTRARALLSEELARREMPNLPIVNVKGLVLPFWGVRGKESAGTFAAFSPLPAALHGFRLPPSGALVSGEPPDGFEAVPCSDNASAVWQAHAEAGPFSLYLVPFYRIGFGAGQGDYVAWLDAVAGTLYLGRTPPPVSDRISRRFWSALSLLFCLFGTEAFLLKGWLALVVVAVTAGVCYPALRGFLEKEGP